MKILHLSAYDGQEGAARAAYRIHSALRGTALESLFLVNRKRLVSTEVLVFDSTFEKLFSLLAPSCDGMISRTFAPPSNQVVSTGLTGVPWKRKAQKLAPDVLHFHWAFHGFVRLDSLIGVSHLPSVFSLHDLWVLGSLTHYPSDFLPEPFRSPESSNFFSQWLRNKKQSVFSRLPRAHFLAHSKWSAEVAIESGLLPRERIHCIPTPLEAEWYSPPCRAEARRVLGFPSEGNIALFGAIRSLSDPRKGFDILREALRNLSGQDPSLLRELLLFGGGGTEREISPNLPIRDFGALNDNLSLRLLYNAANVFLMPSRIETFGQTALEALACGTPVVAFDLGGVRDLISHRQNGYLARPYDIDDFVRGITWVLQQDEGSIGAVCRRSAEKYAESQIGPQYEALYREIS